MFAEDQSVRLTKITMDCRHHGKKWAKD